MPIRPRGILLDMDGTLTRPNLDFVAIKADLGLPAGVGILEALAPLPADERAELSGRLHAHELCAAEASELADGCHALFDWLSGRLPFAVITRNTRACVDVVWRRHGLPECPVVTREDAPHKPDAAPLHLASRRLGVSTHTCWMVGDGQYDVLAARAAGAAAVWVANGPGRYPHEAPPDATVACLNGVCDLLRRWI